MSKKMLKTSAIFLMTILMILTIVGNVFALEPSDIVGSTNTTGSDEIQSVGQDVVGILQVVGIVLSVIVLIILGIKYMIGSAEEKAEYKKTMLPYIVGAALIFAASAFAQVVYQFFFNISSGS